MNQAKLPKVFEEQMRHRLGQDFPLFAEALSRSSPTSLHHNPAKPTTISSDAAVNWHKYGHYLDERPSFTLDPLFHAGAYYVQEASSMMVAFAAAQLFPSDKPLRVLDLCAAPGGKSTLLASMLPPGSWLLSNEVINSRYQVLKYNLTKWGLANTFVSSHDSKDFAPLEGFFDLVLVDAPCSGEGLFRKDPAAIDEWSEDLVKLCAARQKRILAAAVPLVKEGGCLLYSTCTYNASENEDNAQWLEQEFDLNYTPLNIPETWNWEQRNRGIQAYPHRVRGEGLYLAAFQKEKGYSAVLSSKPFQKLNPIGKKNLSHLADWVLDVDDFVFFEQKAGDWRAIQKNLLPDAQILSSVLSRFEAGSLIGQPKGKDWLPAAAWALQVDCAKTLPSVSLDKTQVLSYLRKETPVIDNLPRGWQLVQYEGQNLGWLKGLGNRYNNYYPKNWRIRMRGNS